MVESIHIRSREDFKSVLDEATDMVLDFESKSRNGKNEYLSDALKFILSKLATIREEIESGNFTPKSERDRNIGALIMEEISDELPEELKDILLGVEQYYRRKL